MALTQQILDAASDWAATLRLLLLAAFAVAAIWGTALLVVKVILPGIATALRGLLKGKKLTTPLGTVEDEPAPATDCQPEPVPLDKVDEIALAHPRDVKASVMSRQLDEVFDALRGVTQILAGGIQEADKDRHLAKRDHLRIVWDAQIEAIVRRLIHNGLDVIQDRDEDRYCSDKAERLFHAFKDDLEERLISRSVDRLDLHEAIRLENGAVLDRLRLMYRTCIQIAKSAYKECA